MRGPGRSLLRLVGVLVRNVLSVSKGSALSGQFFTLFASIRPNGDTSVTYTAIDAGYFYNLTSSS